MKRRKKIALAITASAVAAIAGYGYWHAATHATFAVHLAYRNVPGAATQLRNGQLEFLDDSGVVLARASTAPFSSRNASWPLRMRLTMPGAVR